MEEKEKIKADTIKFERENKLCVLPKLQITPFTAPQDWLSWVVSITSIAKTYTKEEIASPQFISLMKASINIEEDKRYCRILDVHLIISYLKRKNLTNGRTLEATLQPIETMPDPKNIATVISNAETLVRILKLLEAHTIEDQIELSTISHIESKTVRKMDQANYFKDMMEKIKEVETPRAPDHESTRLGDGELVISEHDPLNLTSDIISVNRISKNSAKREFLKKYFIDKIPVWRALQESKTTVIKFGKLTSDPNKKTNVPQNKGIFILAFLLFHHCPQKSSRTLYISITSSGTLLKCQSGNIGVHSTCFIYINFGLFLWSSTLKLNHPNNVNQMKPLVG